MSDVFQNIIWYKFCKKKSKLGVYFLIFVFASAYWNQRKSEKEMQPGFRAFTYDRVLDVEENVEHLPPGFCKKVGICEQKTLKTSLQWVKLLILEERLFSHIPYSA